MRSRKNFEDVFPILKVENDCIISKRGDISVGYKVILPEIFTLSTEDFENFHQSWVKAIRTLPVESILHKQDIFFEKEYKADFSNTDASFLSQSSELHFNERKYLDHTCLLFFTKRAPNRKAGNSLSALVASSSWAAPNAADKKLIGEFLDKVSQAVKILENSGYVEIIKLSTQDLASDNERAGIIEKYCFLQHDQDHPIIKDIEISNDLVIGDMNCQIFTLSDVEDLPSVCGSRINYDKYSTDRTKFSIAFAAPLGQMLNCNHIYNQYLWISDPQLTIKKLEAKKLKLQSLSTYSRENTIGRDAVNDFLNEAISDQRLPIKAHFNLICWTNNPGEVKAIKNKVAAALAQMDARTKQETAIAALLFLAAVPGNEADLPEFEMFDTFAEQATCFFNIETSYKSSISPVGIRLADRIHGFPLNVDLSLEPRAKGWTTNSNKFVLGGSGTGKSYWCLLYLRSYVEQGAHAVVVDIGHSYQGLCALLGGYYYTYTEKNPIKFNPFYLGDDTLDTEKKDSLKTLILSLWKKDDQPHTRAEYVAVSNALQSYYGWIQSSTVEIFPCFNTFYEFLREQYVNELHREGVKEKDFDMNNFLYVLKPYYTGGEFDYLLNSRENLDVINQRFVVFEIDNISGNAILFSVVTLMIMEIFISKMRKLKGVRKIILIEEAWKALMTTGMAEYIKYLFKTVRKFSGEAVVVTQEVEDIVSSDIVKQAIINNSDCKVLLDQSKYQNKFNQIQELLGLSDKDKAIILSINKANDPALKYKEVFISLGSSHSMVYRTEVSLEEYLAYTTEEKEKIKVQAYTAKYGSIKKGIIMLARDIRSQADTKLVA